MAKLKIIHPDDKGFQKGIEDGSIVSGADTDAAIAALTPEEIEKELGKPEEGEPEKDDDKDQDKDKD